MAVRHRGFFDLFGKGVVAFCVLFTFGWIATHLQY